VVKNLIYKGFMEMKLKTKCTPKLSILSFNIFYPRDVIFSNFYYYSIS
jgi:hypothetical protein